MNVGDTSTDDLIFPKDMTLDPIEEGKYLSLSAVGF